MLKRVREHRQETCVVGRRAGDVRVFFLASEDIRLGRQRTAVHLTPVTPAVLWNQGSSPQANLLRALIDDERRENVQGLLKSLNMLVVTDGGFDFTGAECQAWMQEAGFSDTQVTSLGGS